MTISPQAEAAATMKRNGKSFWFASLFLPRHVAADAARLYAFCRTMDDLADVAVTQESRARLAQVRQDLHRGVTSTPEVQDFFSLAQQYNLPPAAADYLIATFIQDSTTELHLADEAELVRYCYGVAGTVGLMMSPLLGAAPIRAGEAAMHLGIAMQMTNIARDVLEDARNHRRYLPGSWVQHITAKQIQEACDSGSGRSRELVALAVARLLDLADQYYASAAMGFDFIPSRARRGIGIAAAVYREIGEGLRRNHCAWWNGRVGVSLPRKIWIAAQVYTGQSPIHRLRSSTYVDHLSQPLIGLPGVR
jgi:phytoene synthase